MHFILLGLILLLCLETMRQDARDLEISAPIVLLLSFLCVLYGVLYPAPGLGPDDALFGAATGLFLGTATRAYTHLRFNAPLFGGADIALITAGGGVLGVYCLAYWLPASAVLAVLGAALPGALKSRLHEGENRDHQVLPYCPALIVSAAIIWGLIEAGVLVTRTVVIQ